MRKSKTVPMVPIDLDNYQQEHQLSPSGQAWEGYGVVLPHGTPVRMPCHGRWHYGIVDDGGWVVGGTRYASPSAAAMGIARTSRNGWQRWQVKRPADPNWVLLRSLRWPEAVRRRKPPLSPAECQRIAAELLA